MKHIFLNENQLQLLREGLYDGFEIGEVDRIYYNIRFEPYDDDEDYEEDEGYFYVDLTAYDYNGETVYECYDEDIDNLKSILGETIIQAMLNKKGYFNGSSDRYCLDMCDYQNFSSIDDAINGIFKSNLTEYYPKLHGYILTNGMCIDLGHNDHNSICALPQINDKFEFIALGNIRCSSNFFDLIKKPTYEQKQCLRKLIANSTDLSVDIFDENGKTILTSVVYRGEVSPSVVLNQIDRFFGEGIKLNPNVDSDDDYLYENCNYEYNQNDVDMSSFEKQISLQQDLWDSEDKLNSRVRLKLLDIADDFIETLGISWIKPIDIILTGSLCNYNWSTYSDVDLHVVIDFSEINVKKDFVQEYFNAKKNEWNENHEELTIFGFHVELYVEDVENDSVRDGIYSLEKDKWIKKPLVDKIQALSSIKEKKIQYLASIALTKIEDIENELSMPLDDVKLRKMQQKVDKLINTLQEIRRSGLKSKGEMSVGNIIYKICRRTGYLDKLWKMKNNIYDKINSL